MTTRPLQFSISVDGMFDVWGLPECQRDYEHLTADTEVRFTDSSRKSDTEEYVSENADWLPETFIPDVGWMLEPVMYGELTTEDIEALLDN